MTTPARNRSRGAHPIGTPRALMANTGPMASAAWLVMLDVMPKDPKWSVEIVLALEGEANVEGAATSFQIAIFAEEWGFSFSHGGQLSWIRVTDVPFVHGRDEFRLLAATPPLKRIGELLHQIERRFQLRFDRAHPAVRTTLAHAEPAVRRWVEAL
ncbi:MAG: hypothetical protein ACM31C_16015 [Acidobacteriota bacterium]